ncbi:bifunctional phosphoglucose/phosphomannose isomerase [soil metagenome]
MIADIDLDPANMLTAIADFHEHLEEGWRRGESLEALHKRANEISNIVVCGMGGSAIGGDIVRTLVEPTSKVPFTVSRQYNLPGFVGSDTLVVVSSYSGGTEETLSAFTEAIDRGARVVVISSGGEVATRAGHHDLPTVIIPGGMQPRAALGYSLGVLLRMVAALDLAPVTSDDVRHAVGEARARSEKWRHSEKESEPRTIARSLLGTLPLFYHGGSAMEAASLRWRSQINENAKTLAYGHALPELNHNEIMGFEALPSEIAQRIVVICLRDADDHRQVARRADVTRSLIEPRVAAWRDLKSEGGSRLSRILWAIQLGDFVSYYLAMEKGIDPTPVNTIQDLKQILSTPR